MRDVASIQEAVLIEQEVKKGERGNPTIVARADLLRQDIWDRWRAGRGVAPMQARLTDAIGKLAEVADRQLAIMERTNSDSTFPQPRSPRPVERPIPKVASDPLQTVAAATIETSTAPLFSQLRRVCRQPHFPQGSWGGVRRS